MTCTVCRCEIQLSRQVCHPCAKAAIQERDDTIQLLRHENARLKLALRPAAPPILLVREGELLNLVRARVQQVCPAVTVEQDGGFLTVNGQHSVSIGSLELMAACLDGCGIESFDRVAEILVEFLIEEQLIAEQPDGRVVVPFRRSR